MKTCPKCDYADKDENSVFCQNCGASFASEANENFSESVLSTGSEKQVKFVSAKKGSSTTGNANQKIIGLVVVIVVGLSLLAMSSQLFSFGFFGFNWDEFNNSQEEFNLSNDTIFLELDIQNSIGLVTVKTDENLAGLNKIVLNRIIYVRSNTEGDMAEVTDYSFTNNSNTAKMTFKEEGFSLINLNFNTKYKYDLVVKMSPDFVLKGTNIKSATGKVNVALEHTNVSSLNAATSTGTIDVNINGVDYFGSEDSIIVSSSTGKINLNVINSTLPALNVESSTGGINIDVINVVFLKDLHNIKSSTGKINLVFINCKFEKITGDWTVETSTGSITATFQDFANYTSSTKQNFAITSSTGSVTINTDFNTDIGFKLDLSTSTGSISSNFLNTGDSKNYSHTSTNYLTAEIVFSFTITSSTGNLVVNN